MNNLKKIFKIVIDVLMYADFVYLLCYGSIHKLWHHGVFGFALFVLFLIHHILNFSYYKKLFKGKYSSKRISLLIVNLLLFILMVLVIISSILMSGLIFEFSNIRASQNARILHLTCSVWCFIIMNIHLAFHTEKLFIKIEKNTKNPVLLCIIKIIYLLLILIGIYAFKSSQIYVYMFNLSMWKASSYSIILAVSEYIFITIATCVLYHIVVDMFKKKKK